MYGDWGGMRMLATSIAFAWATLLWPFHRPSKNCMAIHSSPVLSLWHYDFYQYYVTPHQPPTNIMPASEDDIVDELFKTIGTDSTMPTTTASLHTSHTTILSIVFCTWVHVHVHVHIRCTSTHPPRSLDMQSFHPFLQIWLIPVMLDSRISNCMNECFTCNCWSTIIVNSAAPLIHGDSENSDLSIMVRQEVPSTNIHFFDVFMFHSRWHSCGDPFRTVSEFGSSQPSSSSLKHNMSIIANSCHQKIN